MAAQKGKDLLLKVDSDGAGTFGTVAGLRSRTIAFNAETVDITHAESAGQWRELLAGAGARSARITGAGIFKDAASDATVRAYVFNGTIRDWQVVIRTSAPLKAPSRSPRSSSPAATTAKSPSSLPSTPPAS
jgi:TP901-1 family phage major tail protein